jgi:hypothetical protein
MTFMIRIDNRKYMNKVELNYYYYYYYHSQLNLSFLLLLVIFYTILL